MSAEIDYQRLRNTYYYEITSQDGYSIDELGDFDFLIPAYPLAEHNNSQRAIFTLQGCVMGDQILNQQVGATTYFSLEVNGLSGMNNNYNSTQVGGVAGAMITLSKQFMIPNIYEEYTTITSVLTSTSVSTAVVGIAPTPGNITTTPPVVTTTPIQRLTGSFDLTNPYRLITGNPSGQVIKFKLRNDAGALIGNNANLNTIVRFTIELIDAD